MKENSNYSPTALTRIMGSPEGQQLFSLLRQTDPAILQQALDAAQAGDNAKANALLEPLTRDKAILALLRQLQGGGALG